MNDDTLEFDKVADGPFTIHQLRDDDVMLINTGAKIFVSIGQGAPLKEKAAAMIKAQGLISKLGMPKETHICRVMVGQAISDPCWHACFPQSRTPAPLIQKQATKAQRSAVALGQNGGAEGEGRGGIIQIHRPGDGERAAQARFRQEEGRKDVALHKAQLNEQRCSASSQYGLQDKQEGGEEKAVIISDELPILGINGSTVFNTGRIVSPQEERVPEQTSGGQRREAPPQYTMQKQDGGGETTVVMSDEVPLLGIDGATVFNAGRMSGLEEEGRENIISQTAQFKAQRCAPLQYQMQQRQEEAKKTGMMSDEVVLLGIDGGTVLNAGRISRLQEEQASAGRSEQGCGVESYVAPPHGIAGVHQQLMKAQNKQEEEGRGTCDAWQDMSGIDPYVAPPRGIRGDTAREDAYAQQRDASAQGMAAEAAAFAAEVRWEAEHDARQRVRVEDARVAAEAVMLAAAQKMEEEEERMREAEAAASEAAAKKRAEEDAAEVAAVKKLSKGVARRRAEEESAIALVAAAAACRMQEENHKMWDEMEEKKTMILQDVLLQNQTHKNRQVSHSSRVFSVVEPRMEQSRIDNGGDRGVDRRLAPFQEQAGRQQSGLQHYVAHSNPYAVVMHSYVHAHMHTWT